MSHLAARLLTITVLASLMGGCASAVAGTPSPDPAALAAATAEANRLGVLAALVDWRDSGGLEHINTVGKDFGAVSAAATAADVTGVHIACMSLLTDVHAAQRFKSVPDAEAQRDWASALSQSEASATDCMNATQTPFDAALLEKSTAEANGATTELAAGAERIRQLTNGSR